MATVAKSAHPQPRSPSPHPPTPLSAVGSCPKCAWAGNSYYCKRTFLLQKMASSQGGVSAVTAPQSQHISNGAQWNNMGVSQHQHQHHTARSLDRALDDAVCSGILNLSGRKLREYPGVSYDLTDTTQAGEHVILRLRLVRKEQNRRLCC